jgi:phosphohistidine phosphatase
MAWTGPDDLRPLSAKGRAQSERLGQFLASVRFRGDVFLTSPRVRARETAEIVAEALGARVAVDLRLAGPLSVDTVEQLLADAGDPAAPVLVGHDPDFSDLLVDLLGGGSSLRMRKGAMACLVAPRPLRDHAAELAWLLPPDLLGR